MGSTLLVAPPPDAWLDRAARTGRPPVAAPQDPWTGYGGVGDYAASNDNTMPVLEAAHRLRDGAHADIAANAVDTGEAYDLVVVGGGISGLTAAWAFARDRDGRGRCRVLENHPIFGGEAKQNDRDRALRAERPPEYGRRDGPGPAGRAPGERAVGAAGGCRGVGRP